ncbi:MAG: DNA repair protein RadA [Zhaonellaceae bacterium]|nr:DNA repair protein RadA [Clostridia bacterium]
MARIKTRFICQECGTETLKWMGKCPGCGSWNSLIEEIVKPNTFQPSTKGTARPVLLTQVESGKYSRTLTKLSELDRVLGGGLVPGSLILLGGDPGIGKSTLLLQMAANLAQQEYRLLYISGEESAEQIKMRAERLEIESGNLYLLPETDLEVIESCISDVNPHLVIIDSIQTIYNPQMTSAPGSVAQVRDCSARFLQIAKQNKITILLVGHVTKDGNLAGPRVLEHMVDTVLYLEGERHHAFRILRGVKNRFGSTNEIGVFEMREQGLVEVLNPSEMFLAERPIGVTGSVVVPCIEGTRPILLELQSLVSPTSFGNPRRLTTGLDLNRLLLMVAVMEKKLGFVLGNQDVYLNIAGGVRIDEPATDLGICMAIASSIRNQVFPSDLLVVGEVGLTGEVRAVSQIEKRLQEAAKFGFKRCLIPDNNLKYLNNKMPIEIIGVRTVEEALQIALKR